MSNKIVTKIFNYGNEKEASWPSEFGDGERGVFHVKDGKCKRGYPESKVVKYGEAPMYISDDTEPYYHPVAKQWTNSKSALRQMDKATGTITTDKVQQGDKSVDKELYLKRKADIRESIQKAVAAIDSGNAPLTEEQRALCAATNERISNVAGIDAFNAMGRISDARGKRYKRKAAAALGDTE